MPPETLPGARRDFRKYERSGPDLRLGGGGGPHRWRGQQQHYPQAPPPPYHQNHQQQQQQQRWYSDFRSPRLLPDHSKQGGWHMYSDSASPGYSKDESCRSVGSCGDGRYFRNIRENRGSFAQKDWKAPSWETAASPIPPGKPVTQVNNLRSVENTRPCQARNSDASYHPPNPLNLSDQSQSLVKAKNNKDSVTAVETSCLGQESEKENCLADWKPLKWSRLGSFASRGSCLSQSSSLKSVGVNSTEIVVEVQPENATTLVQSPCAGAACFACTAPTDEAGSRKRQRLGWGEGLAKYEKKKVESPKVLATKNELVLSVISTETLQTQSDKLPEKSPRIGSLSNCDSPATLSSVACSSSLVTEKKELVKEANVNCDTTNMSCSPRIVSQVHYDNPSFNLENLELPSIANLSYLINELLQSSNPSSAETDFVRTTSMNKLLVLKDDILKALETTESEIVSLEAEHKSLVAKPRICCLHPAGSSSRSGKQQLKPCERLVTASECGIRLDPLQIDSPGEMIVDNEPVGPEDVHVFSKGKDIDSPGSAMSKFVQLLPAIFPSDAAEYNEVSRNLDVNSSSNMDEECLKNGLSHEESSGYVDTHVLIGTTNREDLIGVSNIHCDIDIYDTIFSSNRDAASRAWEQLNILPKQCLFESSAETNVSSFQKDPSVFKEKFLSRKRFLQLKEKILTLKFKVFQHFWKESRLVSIKKLRVKTQKNFDPSRNGHKRNHPSILSRASSYGGGPQTVSEDEVIEFVNNLLSKLAFKPYRSTLNMPALILDKEVKMSRFISNNGLVEDPCAVENERSIINPWTSEERETFVNKLAAFGKDFRKIASFLDHKTVSDCIEFYYKNHKSECFEKTRKSPGFGKQKKSRSVKYLVASGKRRNPELNASSLDILGAASEIAANIDDGMNIQQKCSSIFSFGASTSCRAPRGDDCLLQGPDSLNTYSNKREEEAADVLASICGSLSSEGMSSCITSSVDPSDGYQDLRGLRNGSSEKRPLTPEDTQDADDECSDESCSELNTTNWSDEERSIFIQAVSTFGKDFAMISKTVRTRSMDQCKLFFSKAKKHLGLDLIELGAGTTSGDVNGGGSDIEDDCTVETGSVTCKNSSECKMDEDLPPPDVKLNHESIMVGAQNLRPDFKISEGSNGLDPLDSVIAEPIVNNSSMAGNHGDDKPITNFNVYCTGQSAASIAFVSVQELQTAVVSSYTKSEQGVEEEDDLDMPNRLSEAEKKALVEVSDEHCGEGNQRRSLLYEEISDNMILDDRDPDSSEVSDISSGMSETKSEPQLAGHVSHPSVTAHSSMQIDKISRHQKDDLGTCSTEKSYVSSLHQNDHVASMMSSILFPVPIKYQKTQNHNASLAVGAYGISDMHCPKNIKSVGDRQQHRPSYSFSSSMESSQVLEGYPVSVQTMKEKNGDFNWEKLTALPNVPQREVNLNSDRCTDSFLEKCILSKKQSKVAEAPFPYLEQSRDHSKRQSCYSFAGDKPPGNGDVKLFGAVLISSQQRTNNSTEITDDNSSQDHETGSVSLDLKLNDDQKVNFDSTRSKFNCNNYIGTEKIPVGSFGIWDGNRMQTGEPPLPDSALLLARYPDAFSNYASCGTGKNSDCCVDTLSVSPSRELSSSKGLEDDQGWRSRGLQPFTIDMKQPQDIMFTEIQRRNGLNLG